MDAFEQAMRTLTPIQKMVLGATARTPEEIGEAAGLSTGTTRNVLAWLVAKGLVERCEDGSWRRTDAVEERELSRRARRHTYTGKVGAAPTERAE